MIAGKGRPALLASHSQEASGVQTREMEESDDDDPNWEQVMLESLSDDDTSSSEPKNIEQQEDNCAKGDWISISVAKGNHRVQD